MCNSCGPSPKQVSGVEFSVEDKEHWNQLPHVPSYCKLMLKGNPDCPHTSPQWLVQALQLINGL